ncbi:hypothetical protein BVRB_3g070490 [Beta vulgaris subsp. vulgaris]|uniref:Uncharacterized protein n=1 Tax=Beta vulgaris subsp. vulgaris TaxID=3555 RepID=A0A0J8BCK1_BETVV|nr:hypothetical protein BVRB_3g070490 [Beta vulgaris subsp. vulgaris]
MNSSVNEENELSDIKHFVLNIKQLKSIVILKSALKLFTCNTKFMFSLILSILPFFIFMVVFEIKLQKTLIYLASNPLPNNPFAVEFAAYQSEDSDQNNDITEFLSNTFQLSIFYLFIYPLLEFLSMILTMKLAINLVYVAEKQATFSPQEVLQQDIKLKGSFMTYLYVHLLSTTTFLGLLCIVSHYIIFSSQLHSFDVLEFWMNVLWTAVHAVIFLGLLYKYLGWSVVWNMGVVISVKEEGTGIAALELASYYGKHSTKTGFELMLSFFVFGNVTRLACLYAGLCNGSVAGVVITCIVVMLISLVNLVKWVACLLHFDYCKQKTMEKKVDDQELGKPVNVADIS